uniref:C-type lectin domain-containing protein n=1 Tax=Strigamia maritima TaxID=126957 RepID=T1JHC8_STRMM
MWLLRIWIFLSKINMIFSILFLTTTLAQTTNPSNNYKNKCPNYWFGNGDICYFISDYLTSWNNAQDFCNYMESDLVIISNEKIQKDINMYRYRQLNSMNVKDFWIGLNDFKSPGDFEWVDETKPMYSNWLNDTVNASGNCVMLDVETQYWKIQNCTSEFGFICSKDWSFNQSLDVEECEGGMKRFLNSCYWTVPGENNWQTAENWCETENGNLTTISSSLENIFVYSFVRQKVGSYWIGLYVDDSGLKWEAENQDTFFNWDGQPEISSGLCAVMERNGKWLMQLCDGNQIKTAICEKPVSATSFPTTHIGTSCPPMWINIENKCYL